MKIRSAHLALLIMVFIFGGVGITSASGLWKTTSAKVPAKYKDGDFSGQYNPADIRGSYTFNDINNSFDVPIEDLGKAFGLTDPDKYAAFQCKELESLYAALTAQGKEIGTSSVRYFVALYKGLPFDSSENIYLLSSAVQILKGKANLTPEQIADIERNSVELPLAGTVSETISKPEITEGKSIPRVIKGNTTFRDLLDWGVKKEDIEKVINDKVPDDSQIIKEYAGTKAIEFGVLKAKLQQQVDAAGK